MNIQQAAKAALETNSCMTRKEAFWGGRVKIKPTDSPDCCLVIQEKVSRRGWEPQAEDLIADDWYLVN